MNEEKKTELFPYFAYIYSQQLDADKYGKSQSIEEWTKTLQENPEDIETITKAAEELSDEDWDKLEAQYVEQNQAQESAQAQLAAKGAKLKKLSKMKTAKCKCGCALISSKDKGGKLVSKCACGCNSKKSGGEMTNRIQRAKLIKK